MLSHLLKLKSLKLDIGDKSSDVNMHHLAGLTELESIDLSLSKISDKTIEILSLLPKIKHLYLNNCYNISNKAVSSIFSKSGIETLDLTLCSRVSKIKEEDAKCASNLRKLSLSCTAVTDNIFHSLQHLESLRILEISSPNLLFTNIHLLSKLLHLNHLIISGNIKKETINNLSLLTRLKRLEISYSTNLDDTDLMELAKLSSLCTLILEGINKISTEGLRTLLKKSSLKSLRVDRCPNISELDFISIKKEFPKIILY